MEIRFRGTLAKEEYLDAVHLASHPVRHKQSLTFQLWILFLFFASIFGLLGIWQLSTSLATSAIFLLLALAFGILGLKLRSVPSQTWERDEEIKLMQEGVATPDALEITTPRSKARNLWSAFAGYGLYKHVLILGTERGIFVPISDRMFASQNDWAQFLELVSQKLPLTYRMSGGFGLRPNPRHLLVLAVLLLTVLILILREAK